MYKFTTVDKLGAILMLLVAMLIIAYGPDIFTMGAALCSQLWTLLILKPTLGIYFSGCLLLCSVVVWLILDSLEYARFQGIFSRGNPRDWQNMFHTKRYFCLVLFRLLPCAVMVEVVAQYDVWVHRTASTMAHADGFAVSLITWLWVCLALITFVGLVVTCYRLLSMQAAYAQVVKHGLEYKLLN